MEEKVQKIYLDKRFRVLSAEGDLEKHFNLFGSLGKGKDFVDLLPRLWQKDIGPALPKALEQGKTFEVEYKVRTKDRKTAYVSLKVEPVVNGGRIEGVSVAVRDISVLQRQRYQAALREKMENLSVLAANISHELNNPLAALLNQIGRLLMEDLTEKDLPRLRMELESIQEQIYAMSIVTNALEAFSKDSQSHFRLLNINSVLEKSIELSKLLQVQSNVTYHVNLAPNLPPVLGNEITLEQSFINIIRNALEAMPSGGVLTVQSSIDKINPDYIQITIKDTGIGIARENIEKIYDPFFKTKNGDHSGLGLSISYGIIANHRGNIEVSSRLNKGTTLMILLPIAKR